MLGAFNMIPIGILDGQNIWKWNKRVYIGLTGSLVVMLILTLLLINSPVGIYI
jgi:Zn-dependent protease